MTPPEGRDDLSVGERALRLAVLTLPHLSGLARTVRLVPDKRCGTAGVFASGRILFNPEFFRSMAPAEGAFVMAHELMHLALHTHRRGRGANQHAVNVAHDYIINDMLVQSFGRPVPGNGLYLEGASRMALEHLLPMLQRGEIPSPGGGPSRRHGPLAGGLGRDPLPESEEPPNPSEGGDVLTDETEREWFPDTDPEEQARRGEEMERAGSKAVGLGVLGDALARAASTADEAGASGLLVGALRGDYPTPWEAALQKWMEFVTPADRTFARPSRRGGDRTDVVLPGRNRVGWTLNIVLDTSGSMTRELPHALGAIASFCESVGVWRVRLLQCDTGVTVDEFVEPERLEEYEVRGLGGSDMSPALRLLAEDPEVEAVVVLTDGYISYPEETMPYHVLWGVLIQGGGATNFQPPYGQVLVVPFR